MLLFSAKETVSHHEKITNPLQFMSGAKKNQRIDDDLHFIDFSSLPMKSDESTRPAWVLPDMHIFLEAFSSSYKQAYDFLIAIAEPLSRPPHVHEYVLTQPSLMSAVSIGMTTKDITEGLDHLSKNFIDRRVFATIRKWTSKHAKVKLVLQKNKYFLESPDQTILQELLQNKVIRTAAENGRAQAMEEMSRNTAAVENAEETNKNSASSHSSLGTASVSSLMMSIVSTAQSAAPSSFTEIMTGHQKSQNAEDFLLKQVIEKDTDESIDTSTAQPTLLFSFRISSANVEDVRRECFEMGYPALNEYDFRDDPISKPLPIELRATTVIRSYQEKSLTKMFGNGRAHSGLIVLPCGAGKTLVGITALATIKRSTVVVCNSNTAVEQWREQIHRWALINEKHVVRFTSQSKQQLSDPCILITTYSMLTTTNRNKESEAVMDMICKRDWGLLIFDEVHGLPARTFRRVISSLKAHAMLGLTATLVREDAKIEDLVYLIGPKLYEANWIDLQREGFLARVQCTEVWCEMNHAFFKDYLASDAQHRRLLYVMNPNKFRVCEYLIKFHEARDDQIIVFCDTIFALKHYAQMLRKPFIFGDTKEEERILLYDYFRHGQCKCIFLSTVGDTAIDLPDANVIIQIASHFGSRRQEAQRLGRILRPKATKGEFNAFFYSLVSRDTSEMYYATKRQQFLVDQGYSFMVVSEIADLPIVKERREKGEPPLVDYSSLHYSSSQEIEESLRMIRDAKKEEGEVEKIIQKDSLEEVRLSKRRTITDAAAAPVSLLASGSSSSSSLSVTASTPTASFVEGSASALSGGRSGVYSGTSPSPSPSPSPSSRSASTSSQPQQKKQSKFFAKYNREEERMRKKGAELFKRE